MRRRPDLVKKDEADKKELDKAYKAYTAKDKKGGDEGDGVGKEPEERGRGGAE